MGLLRNYKILKVLNCKYFNQNVDSSSDANISKVISIDGATTKQWRLTSTVGNDDSKKSNFAILSNLVPVFGNGTTKVTPQDYNLGNDISTSLSNATITENIYTYNEDSDTVERVLSISAINNISDAITISEVGLLYPVYNLYSDSGSWNTKYILIFRELIEPTTVPAGGNIVIELKWVEG